MAIQQPQILERYILGRFAVRQRRVHVAVNTDSQVWVVVCPFAGLFVEQKFEAAVSGGVAGYFVSPHGLAAFEADFGGSFVKVSVVDSTPASRPRLYDFNLSVVGFCIRVYMEVCGACGDVSCLISSRML